MRRVQKADRKNQSPLDTPCASAGQLAIPIDDGTAMLAMIQALIPLGLKAVEEALTKEVTALAGVRYSHDDDGSSVVRWGAQRGSVYVADQKLPIKIPRVRDLSQKREVPLETYKFFQTPRSLDAGLFRRVLGGLSTREYEAAAEAVPEAFGISRSSVSRRFITVSAQRLKGLLERKLDDRQWLVLVLDGKTFAKDSIVIALGVTRDGEKRVLGIVQTATENKRVCSAFLREIMERGFSAPHGLLVVLDGSKGLSSAVRDVFGDRVQIQRCQWHKRENVLSYLAKSDKPLWRRKLCAAYAHASYSDAKRALQRLTKELRVLNESAARSLEEGLEETLTLHRLNVYPELGRSFKTTNLIENVMSQVEARTLRVDRWRTSNQKLRWCASAVLAVEERFRRVVGCTHLPLLERALQATITPSAIAAA